MIFPRCNICNQESCKQNKAIQYDHKNDTCTGFESVLIPCPICGKTPDVIEEICGQEPDGGEHYGYWIIRCEHTNAKDIFSYDFDIPDDDHSWSVFEVQAGSKKAVIKAWNERSELAGLNEIDINDRIYFILWLNLQLYREDMKNMPLCYKELIHNAVSHIGIDKFNENLSSSVKKIDSIFVNSINQHTLDYFKPHCGSV